MPRQHHFSDGNHLHFITASTYRRVRLFDSPRFQSRFIETLDALKHEHDFRLVGYVLMPEHFHLLIWPSKTHSPSRIIGSLKQRTARHIIESLKRCEEPWCHRTWIRSCCLRPFTTSPRTEFGNGGSMTSMSGQNRSGWKSLNTCMETLRSEDWWRIQEIGRGRVGGSIIWVTAVYL